VTDKQRQLSDHLRQKLADLPDKPGVYLMKDDEGVIIYVGKASSLKNRVRSYFQNPAALDAKTAALVSKIVDLETVVVDSARDALILESHLIKEHRPHYNVRLRDDKHYPYFQLTMTEEFPRLLVARRAKNDGNRYFGPYINSTAMREAAKLISEIFPLRSCKTMRKRHRACLNSHIGRCLAPCEEKISREEYAKIVEQVILFLQGKTKELCRQKKKAMQEASENLCFEEAARYRDQLAALEEVQKQQHLDRSFQGGNYDILAVVVQDDQAVTQVFFVRQGKVIGKENFFLLNANMVDKASLMSRFLQEYYGEGENSLPCIYLNHLPEDADLLEQLFSEKCGRKVSFVVPQRGDKKNLVDLAEKNAQLILEQYLQAKDKQSEKNALALEDLRQALGLDKTPTRMECYDISHLSGSNMVGSMVVFICGAPSPKHYRRFRIKSVADNNDFACLREVLSRRWQRGLKERAEGKEPLDFGIFPDLVIIDGGKGQLSSVCEELADIGIVNVNIISLAKEQEKIFLPHCKEPLCLPKDRPALQLLQRIRDEAHRFAVSYHRDLRAKAQVHSQLEEVPGIGQKRLKSLLRTFGSLERIKKASFYQLANAPSMNEKAAATLWQYLHGKEQNGI
jgi:excinuclease ABC subunit C